MVPQRKVSFSDQGKTIILNPQRALLKKVGELAKRAQKTILIFGCALLVVLWGVFARADIYEYYPSSCLGTWENVENVLGEPDLEIEQTTEFSLENSARMNGVGSQIFCGNFTGDDSGEKTFQHAKISFIWAFIEKEHSPEAEEDVSLSESTTTASTTITETIENSAEEEPIINPITPSSTNPSSTTETDPLTWLHRSFFLRALANTTGTETINQTTTQISEIEIIHNEPTTNSQADSSQSVQTSTLDVPFDLEPPPTSDDFVISGGETDVVQITYSLDGETWRPLATVSEHNWQSSTFSLGVESWEDMQNLQIAIKGLDGASRIQDVFLDGIRIEVEAVPVEKAQSNEDFVPQPTPPTQSKSLFDPSAKHSCTILPFSQKVTRGESVLFSLSLQPSATERQYVVSLGKLPSETEASLIASKKTTPITQITSTDPTSSSTPEIVEEEQIPIIPLDFRVDTTPLAEPGSFSMVVTYEETQPDGIVLSNFCQYNLIIE